uniref:hypothetical protein n=1 Tax=uncultured Draconibacterium sp. TaxID=1573823 RepID=UPI003217C2E3
MKYINLHSATGYPYRLKLKIYQDYIIRFMHLLNVVAPGKYQLETLGLSATVLNTETQLTELVFSTNPFRYGTL